MLFPSLHKQSPLSLCQDPLQKTLQKKGWIYFSAIKVTLPDQVFHELVWDTCLNDIRQLGHQDMLCPSRVLWDWRGRPALLRPFLIVVINPDFFFFLLHLSLLPAPQVWSLTPFFSFYNSTTHPRFLSAVFDGFGRSAHIGSEKETTELKKGTEENYNLPDGG